jgi:hypothetical protein
LSSGKEVWDGKPYLNDEEVEHSKDVEVHGFCGKKKTVDDTRRLIL